jgi:NADH-quinone oxidoreductase subunit E
MLSEQERHEIDAEIRMLPHKRMAVIEALKVVQRRKGWCSDDEVRDVAEYLAMSPAQVDSIATFYAAIYRRPVGRHVILICDSVSCWVTGYHGVLDHLKARLGIDLGQTTADGRFTLIPNACLGVCEIAPAMMVDEDVHGNLTPGKVDEILARYE